MNTVQFFNEATPANAGWAMLAPFGEYPGIAWIAGDPREVVQIVDQIAGEALQSSMRHFVGSDGPFLRAIPIFNGHPDAEGYNGIGDPEIKGWIGDLQVQPNGIFVLPALNDAGQRLVNENRYLALSAHAQGDVVGERNGRSIVRWTRLISVGLTSSPNLPVQLLNDGCSAIPQGGGAGYRAREVAEQIQRIRALNPQMSFGEAWNNARRIRPQIFGA